MNSQNSQHAARKPRVSKRPIPAYRETLSATAAKALRAASIVAVDYVFDDLSHLDDPDTTFDDDLLGMFYPQARLPRYTQPVARKLYLCIVLVGWQLAQDDQLLHASVAEELAGHALIETAKFRWISKAVTRTLASLRMLISNPCSIQHTMA